MRRAAFLARPFWDYPSGDRRESRMAIRFADLVDAFLEGHGPKLKARTREEYDNALRKHAVPIIGHMRAETITAGDLNKVHLKLADRPYRANRVMAYVGSVYSWGAKNGYVPKSTNPAPDVRRFREEGRERYLTAEELERLGTVLRQAETQGRALDHQSVSPNREACAEGRTPNCRLSTARDRRDRLLLFTGCRLRGNSELALGRSRSAARAAPPSRFQDRTQDRHPERSGNLRPIVAGEVRALCHSWNRTGKTAT